MKLLQATNDGFVFEFTEKEKELFLAVLGFYPLLNPDYHRLSKSAAPEKIAEHQQMLRDAMAEQQRTNRKQLSDFVEGIDWNRQQNGGLLLNLTESDIDWLLVILNDVRVGSWDILGRPTHEERDKLDLQSKNSHYYGVMELSGLFQSAFLHALENRE